jgi:hypothetical protein
VQAFSGAKPSPGQAKTGVLQTKDLFELEKLAQNQILLRQGRP